MSDVTLTNDDFKWLGSVARNMTSHDSSIDRDDLVQEGAIAWANALEKSRGDNPRSFAKKAAIWRMQSVAIDGRVFGSERGHGTAIKADAHDATSPVWSTQTATYFDASMAYHRNEIRKAIDELPSGQRRYVKLRFWGGFNQPELTELFGYMPSRLWTQAKKHLSISLAHLVVNDA